MSSSSDERAKKIIQEEMKKLTKNIKLIVFTSLKKQSDGTKVRECEDCNVTMGLLRIYQENSNGKLLIEENSIYDEPEFAKKYDVQRVPTILLIDDRGKEIVRYLANPVGQETTPFVQSVFALAGAPNYFENAIKQYLPRIERGNIKIFITMSCPYCPQVVTIANLFAIASEGKIRSIVVDIERNPDIGQFYDVNGVPYTLVNDKTLLAGMVGPQEILKALIGGNFNVQF